MAILCPLRARLVRGRSNETATEAVVGVFVLLQAALNITTLANAQSALSEWFETVHGRTRTWALTGTGDFSRLDTHATGGDRASRGIQDSLPPVVNATHARCSRAPPTAAAVNDLPLCSAGALTRAIEATA